MKNKNFNIFLIFLCLTLLSLAACNNDEPATPTATAPAAESTDSDTSAPTSSSDDSAGYPAQSQSEAGYPGEAVAQQPESGYVSPAATTEGVLPEPPNPERNLPAADEENGVIGGVLVREILDEGFVPFKPYELILGTVVYNSDGVRVYVRYNEEDRRAQLFDTGIFVFSQIPPGEYGLIADLGFTQFPIQTPEGGDFIITVEAGQAQDLGQILVRLPGE